MPKTIPKKILIVEDNPQNLRVIQLSLKGQGYILREATDGKQALMIALRERPDLIIMDIQLPRMSGLEVTTRLRARPNFNNVPIVAVTAYAMKGDREKAISIGFDAYLTKPISPRELSSLVAEMLMKKREADTSP
ncbi:MAG: response regulator [Dehalococcoidales bacterium]|jgi:CheY-like chemotaxis protein